MDQGKPNLKYHYSVQEKIVTSPENLFNFLNNPHNLSAHMSQSSWMMLGSKMVIETDKKKGQELGSEIKLIGQILGFTIFVKENVTVLERPFKKVWQTQGIQKLIVIDQYKMGFTISPKDNFSVLEVFIDYSLPPNGITFILGWVFGQFYAKWCTQKMIKEAQSQFQ